MVGNSYSPLDKDLADHYDPLLAFGVYSGLIQPVKSW